MGARRSFFSNLGVFEGGVPAGERGVARLGRKVSRAGAAKRWYWKASEAVVEGRCSFGEYGRHFSGECLAHGGTGSARAEFAGGGVRGGPPSPPTTILSVHASVAYIESHVFLPRPDRARASL